LRPFGGLEHVRSRLGGLHIAVVGPPGALMVTKVLLEDLGVPCDPPPPHTGVLRL
jgi:hypothetical protein